MDEWMVHRPHHNRLRGVVGQPNKGEAQGSGLLASRVRIEDGPRGGWHGDPRLNHREDGAQVPFGRDPNDRVEKALAGTQPGHCLGLTEPRALAGRQHDARDRNLLDG